VSRVRVRRRPESERAATCTHGIVTAIVVEQVLPDAKQGDDQIQADGWLLIVLPTFALGACYLWLMIWWALKK
jgi:hypothetical protein